MGRVKFLRMLLMGLIGERGRGSGRSCADSELMRNVSFLLLNGSNDPQQ
jgi:hypothetical protein